MQILGLEFTSSQLMRLVGKGEGETIEFKEEVGKAHEFCETLVAFSNRRGGDILIGVQDDGTIVGVPDSAFSKIKDQITSISHEFCYQSVHFNEVVVERSGMRVVVVRVSEGVNKPYWLKDKGPFIREGSHDRVMTRHEAEQAFQR